MSEQAMTEQQQIAALHKTLRESHRLHYAEIRKDFGEEILKDVSICEVRAAAEDMYVALSWIEAALADGLLTESERISEIAETVSWGTRSVSSKKS